MGYSGKGRRAGRLLAGLATMAALAGLPALADIPDGFTTRAAFGTEGANKFRDPVWLGEIPGRTGNMLVGEHHTGNIYLLAPEGAAYQKSLFKNIPVKTVGEQGLLSVAFHPGFPDNRKYYVHYTAPTAPRRTVIEEREAAPDFRKDSDKPPRFILEIPLPEGPMNHNGGAAVFGPDGMLYISTGDGGQNSSTSQDMGLLLGKVLRIQVDATSTKPGYSVPADNPFVGRAGARPEIWALGFRNPWRMSWDLVGKVLYVGDVGGGAKEEISAVRKGENMGWPKAEGMNCNGCTPEMVKPLIDHGRAEAQCILGGVAFRGAPSSTLNGIYFYADHATFNIFALEQTDRVVKASKRIGSLTSKLNTVNRDATGRIYIASAAGVIYQLLHPQLIPGDGTPTGLAVPGSFPSRKVLARRYSIHLGGFRKDILLPTVGAPDDRWYAPNGRLIKGAVPPLRHSPAPGQEAGK